MTLEEKRAHRRQRYAASAEIRTRNYQRKKEWIKRNPSHWASLVRERNLKEPFIKLVSKSRTRARESGIENDLTISWARDRWTGACEITGIKFRRAVNGKQNSFSPSIDRIDSSKGYTQTNCRFILCALNRFKGDDTDDVMYLIARILVGCKT